MGQEAIKASRGQLTKGLVYPSKGVGLHIDDSDKPREAFGKE